MPNGACLCGAVSFEVSGALPPPDACHCSQCRKQSGHYWASTDVLRTALKIDGAENSRGSAHRHAFNAVSAPSAARRFFGTQSKGTLSPLPWVHLMCPPERGWRSISSWPTRVTTTTLPTVCRKISTSAGGVPARAAYALALNTCADILASMPSALLKRESAAHAASVASSRRSGPRSSISALSGVP